MRERQRFNRRELLGMLALVGLLWLVLLAGLARWQRGRAAPATAEPQLVHYPGTENVAEQTSANLGLRKYWFRLEEEYPSESVYRFYRDQLEPKGWRPIGAVAPQWVRRSEKDVTRDLFATGWISPDGLFHIDLQMMSVVHPAKEGSASGEERERGIRVYVTLRRSAPPEILLDQRPGPTPGIIKGE
ncbi:MAG: hypothetical protein ACE149_07650 [Armatimonadota bacterium]